MYVSAGLLFFLADIEQVCQLFNQTHKVLVYFMLNNMGNSCELIFA